MWAFLNWRIPSNFIITFAKIDGPNGLSSRLILGGETVVMPSIFELKIWTY